MSKHVCPLCGVTFEEDYCPICGYTDPKHQSQEWWMPYAEPLPTWETTERYPDALGHLRARPFSKTILNPNVRAYIAGFTEADGFIGYWIRAGRIYASPFFSVEVSDRRAVQFIAKATRRSVYQRKTPAGYFRYKTIVSGLPAIAFYRIIEPSLHGHGKDKAQFLIQHGFKVTMKTVNQFAKTFPFGRRYTRRILLPESPSKLLTIHIIESPQRPETPLQSLEGIPEEDIKTYFP